MSSATYAVNSGSNKFKNTQLRSLLQIFSENAIIQIPYFQRNYSWKSVNSDSRPVAKLWSDLIGKYNQWLSTKIIDNAEYMLGTMVFVKENSVGNIDKFEVVDGQQRISTFTMLLCITRDLLIENHYSTISKDMGTWPTGLDFIIKLVEILEPVPISQSGITREDHKHWKLKMNRTDAEIYKKYVQEYESDLSHTFSEPGKDFIQISKKTMFLEEQLTSKTPSIRLSSSQRLIIEAYVFLYKSLQEKLIVALLDTPESTDDLEKYECESEKSARDNIEKNPNSDEFKLGDDFFKNDVDGLNVLETKTWSANEYENKFSEKYERWSNTKQGEGKSKDEYIKKRISTYLRKLKPVLEKEKEKVHTTLCAKKRKDHLPELFQFIRYIVMERMFVTRAEVNDEKDAFQIFDTMNSAGTDLSKSNLIKNLIIKHVAETEQEEIAKKWDDNIIEKVSLPNADTFILQSLRSRGLEDPSSGRYIFDQFHVKEHDKVIVPSGKNLYDVIRWVIENTSIPGYNSQQSSEKVAKNFVDTLVEDAEIYEYLNGNDPNPPLAANPFTNLAACIHDMNYLNAKYIRIAMYTAYREWKKNSNEFLLLIKFLVPFFFKYKTVSDKNATKLELNMIKVCQIIKNGNSQTRLADLYKIIKFLLSTYPDDEFTNDFDKTWNDENTIKYVLHRINTFLADKYTDVKAIDHLQLEHIFPQKPKTTSVADGGWDKNIFFADYDPNTDEPKFPAEFNSSWSSGLLGNMTLLHYETNKTIGNSNFAKKLSWTNSEGIQVGYEKSNLPINVETVVSDETNKIVRKNWTANSIINRTSYLNEKALDVWKLPEIYCANVQCYGATHPVTVKGTFKEVLETKCSQEKDKNGNLIVPSKICGDDLEVKWHKCAPEYQVPTAYTID